MSEVQNYNFINLIYNKGERRKMSREIIKRKIENQIGRAHV